MKRNFAKAVAIVRRTAPVGVAVFVIAIAVLARPAHAQVIEAIGAGLGTAAAVAELVHEYIDPKIAEKDREIDKIDKSLAHQRECKEKTGDYSC